MTTLLIHRARCIATQDDANTELNDASLLICDGRIERIIPATENTEELVKQAEEVIDARRHVVVPGLINTYHHMHQSLTRAIPGLQNNRTTRCQPLHAQRPTARECHPGLWPQPHGAADQPLCAAVPAG